MAVSDLLRTLPTTWVVLAVLILGVVASLIRRSQNAKLNRPPVFEGIPLIGGILKFLKVADHQELPEPLIPTLINPSDLLAGANELDARWLQ